MAVAFMHAYRTVSGIRWPYDFDALRDVGTAQSILDGDYPGDYLYEGETLWYNPLVGAMVAVGSKVSGEAPHRVDVALGPFVNLLVPVSFFVLVSVLAGPWSALAALALFLFGVAPSRATWLTATYSPWLFAPNFSLSLFFITLALCLSLRRTGWRGRILIGIAWGITFIGHTAPAIMFGAILAILTLAQILLGNAEDGPWRARLPRSALGFALSAAVAFIFSLPYTYSILWRYRFRVRHFAPISYVDECVTLKNLPHLLAESLSVFTLVAAIGLIAVALSKPYARAKRVTLVWCTAATAFLAYSYACQWYMSTGASARVFEFMPGYHFLPYLAAAKSLLFGIGVSWLSQAVAAFAKRIAPTRLQPFLTAKHRLVRNSLVLICTGVSCASLYPTYVTWQEFSVTKDLAGYAAARESFEPIYAWIRANTRPSDVFLCTSVDDTVRIVGSAGRKAVAPMRYFANIYVEYDNRAKARQDMLEALRQGNIRAFRAYAEPYGVRFLLTRDDELGPAIKKAETCFVPRTRDGALAIYEVRQPAFVLRGTGD